MDAAKKKASATSYHHGDLRNALIVAAAELIEESGSEDFAMIDAARRAGVSNAAPYRHFCDRDALLQAVGELGYHALATALNEISAQHELGSTEAIIALGKYYLRFVVSKKPFFNLMWGERGYQNLLDLEGRSDLHHNGFWLLVRHVEAWLRRETIADVDPAYLAMKLWAMSIGTAHMALNYDLEHFVEGVDLDEIVESSSMAFLQGARLDT
jgi:AcrR family transcriptional regulator